MNLVDQYLTDKLKDRELAGNLRSLTTQKLNVDFFSNDYLGLVTDGILADLINKQPQNLCTPGSTGSRLLSGNNVETELVENTIAGFHSAEAALLFNSGYNANIGLIASITSRNAVLLYDELCHASIIDGIRLSLTQNRYKFKHNDPGDLEEKIKKYGAIGPVIVIVESVYSMDGDFAPLIDLVQVCRKYNAQLIVDEAHATGVFGKSGEGLVCALELQDAVFARVHTFGKALGCHGAAIVGSNLLKQYLINYSRPFIYTTALPGHSVQAAKSVYQYMSSPDFSNEVLHGLIRYFRNKIQESGNTEWIDSISPIQALIIGDNIKAKSIATTLQNTGLQVKAILSPTVPIGKERLRICLHTFNTKEQVDLLHVLCRK